MSTTNKRYRGREVLAVFIAAGVLAVMLAVVALTPRPAGAAEVTVGVGSSGGGNVFEPSSITIAPGDTVTWNWVSGFHSVVAVDGSFDSGTHGTPGAPFSQTFNSPGTIFYYCSVHAPASAATDAGIAGGAMAGKIVVAQAQSTATAAATATSDPTATSTAAPTATGTAAPMTTATPRAPSTGQAGLAGSTSDAGGALLLLGLAVVTVLGARTLTQRMR